jgi:hypothetical protein
MSNEQLISTLRTAAEAESNIALKMLLIMAAERIEELNK